MDGITFGSVAGAATFDWEADRRRRMAGLLERMVGAIKLDAAT
jgi:hypothetical protein